MAKEIHKEIVGRIPKEYTDEIVKWIAKIIVWENSKWMTWTFFRGIAKKASYEILEENLKGITGGFSKQIAEEILKISAKHRSNSRSITKNADQIRIEIPLKFLKKYS